MFEIPIFKAEKEAGLIEKVRASTTLAFSADVQVVDKKFAISESCTSHLGATNVSKGATEDFDLHYLKTVLVSTGWNKNDDVFDRMETWGARHTPEDKPFNYEHNCADIIGHITGNYVMNEQGEVVDNTSTVDDLPAKFHVVAGAVLYKCWDKPELQERMDNILREIAEGKWFVSMEALFRGFDYAVVAKDGTARVIARNEETAFLTKHLRVYGGDGTYEELKVGRLLRNIVFSGKGLVRKPANPDSVILTQANIFSASFGNLSDFSPTEKKLGYSNTLPECPKEAEPTMSTELQTEIDALKAQLKASQENLAKEAEQTKTLTVSLEKATVDGQKIADELAKIRAEQKHAKRVAAVKSVLNVEDAEAVELANSLAVLSDEAFEAHLKTIAKFTPAPIPAKQTPAKDAPKATSKPAPMSGKATEDEVADSDADVEVLETAETETEPALATVESSEEVDKVRQSIAAYFGCELDEEPVHA